jgi:PAS domain S-box-containing protein
MSQPPRDREASIRKLAEPFDIAGQSVIATTPDGIIVYWSRGAAEMYGWTAAEAVGRNVVDVTPSPEMREQAVDIMAHLVAGHVWSGRFQVRHRDGTSFDVHVRNVPISDGSGDLIGIVGLSNLV